MNLSPCRGYDQPGRRFASTLPLAVLVAVGELLVSMKGATARGILHDRF